MDLGGCVWIMLMVFFGLIEKLVECRLEVIFLSQLSCSPSLLCSLSLCCIVVSGYPSKLDTWVFAKCIPDLTLSRHQK